MKERRIVRVVGLVVVIVGAVAALGTLLVRDQMSRHRRNLFSPQPLRRLAALGYLAGHDDASIDMVRLMRDYIAWEPRPLLKKRAVQILDRMERRLGEEAAASTEAMG